MIAPSGWVFRMNQFLRTGVWNVTWIPTSVILFSSNIFFLFLTMSYKISFIKVVLFKIRLKLDSFPLGNFVILGPSDWVFLWTPPNWVGLLLNFAAMTPTQHYMEVPPRGCTPLIFAAECFAELIFGTFQLGYTYVWSLKMDLFWRVMMGLIKWWYKIDILLKLRYLPQKYLIIEKVYCTEMEELNVLTMKNVYDFPLHYFDIKKGVSNSIFWKNVKKCPFSVFELI